MARAKLTSLQEHQSWRDAVRNVRKRGGTPEPQDVLLNTWPSLWTLFFAASQRGHTHCSWKSKKLQDAASLSPASALNVSLQRGMLVGQSHLGRQNRLLLHRELGGVKGNPRITELLTLPWVKPSLGSGYHAALLPLELPPCF